MGARSSRGFRDDGAVPEAERVEVVIAGTLPADFTLDPRTVAVIVNHRTIHPTARGRARWRHFRSLISACSARAIARGGSCATPNFRHPGQAASRPLRARWPRHRRRRTRRHRAGDARRNALGDRRPPRRTPARIGKPHPANATRSRRVVSAVVARGQGEWVVCFQRLLKHSASRFNPSSSRAVGMLP